MSESPLSRRQFGKQVAGMAAAATVLTAPFVHAADKSGNKPVVIGTGDYQYECHHNWGQVPAGWRWGAAHGVCLDRDGLIYMTHQLGGNRVQDAVAVFKADGTFVRSFGKQFHGGGHGLDLREEEGTQYLYLSDVKNRTVNKLTLDGEVLWSIGAPAEAGVYQENAKFVPTNVGFNPDGGLFVADGYGSSYIHRYTRDGKYLSTFGGPGSDLGQLKTPHGLGWDARPGRTPALLVADRANARLQYFDASGKPISTVSDLPHPCHVDTREAVALVPDLFARVSLFDGDNQPLVHLGDDPEWTKEVLANNRAMRRQPDRWLPGKFVHPHDAAFDQQGNIFVMEWTEPGRVTFLKRV